MSSILKALKKLESEKTARMPHSMNIDAEILRNGPAAPRVSYLGVSLLALLFFASGVAFTFYYVKRGTAKIAAPQPVTGVSAVTAAKPSSPPQKVQALPAKQAEQQRLSQRQAPTVPHPSQSPARTQSKPVRTIPTTRIARPAAVSTPPPTPPATVQPVSPGRVPTLKVDGIAYHGGSSDSLAIVNGITAYVGAVIEGAKVEEIGKDRIRFSYGGEKFEVPLGKSNR